MFSTIRNRRSFRWALVAALCASPVMAQQSGLSGRPGAPNNTQNNQGIQQPAGQGNSQLGQGNPQAGTQQQLGTQQGGLRPTNQTPANQPGVANNQLQQNSNVRPQAGNQQFGAQQPGMQPQQAMPARDALGNRMQQQPQGNAQAGNGQANQQGANQPGANQPGGNQQIPVVGVQQAVNAGLANVVQQPFPNLNDEELKYIDTVLNIWEKRTAAINTFECKFKRFVVTTAVDPVNPSSISEGFIRFKNPDKGVFYEEGCSTLAGKKPDGSPDYKVDPNRPNGDWWVCDGEWVHNLDRNQKKAVRVQLPPELRGNNIPLSPLPFLFGVKALEVKGRYFVRPLPPPAGNNDIWIEAWPKRADDAGNYSRVQISLDRKDSLPNAMVMFMPNWTPQNPDREVFNFSGREVNSSNLLDKIKENVFMKAFIETKVGADWEVIQEPWIPPQQMQQAAPNGQPAPNGGQPSGGNQPAGRVAAPPTQPPR